MSYTVIKHGNTTGTRTKLCPFLDFVYLCSVGFDSSHMSLSCGKPFPGETPWTRLSSLEGSPRTDQSMHLTKV